MGISVLGSYVAIITPFDSRGRIDVKRIESLVRWQIERGTDGIVCLGSTGEAAVLNERERKKILQACLGAAEKKIQIIAGTGTCDTRQTVRLTQIAQKLGADGCLVIAPYYNKPSQKGCFLHYQAVSSVGLPFIIYNNPGRSVVRLEAKTIAEISRLPSAFALKEATNDLTFFQKVRSCTTLPILAGEDALTLEMLSLGASGAISVIGNAFPTEWKRMIDAARNQDLDLAKQQLNRLQPVLKILGEEGNPGGIKMLLSVMGLAKQNLRLPLVEPEESFRKNLRSALIQFNLPLSFRSMPCS